MDKILIDKLCIRSSLSAATVQCRQVQPFLISVSIFTDCTASGKSDDLTLSIDYYHIAQTIIKTCDGKIFQDIFTMANAVADACPDGLTAKSVIVEQPRGSYRASSVGIQMKKNLPTTICKQTLECSYFVNNLQLSTIIGVNPEERIEKQIVIVNLNFNSSSLPNIHGITLEVSEMVESSNFQTVEALALNIGQLLKAYCNKYTVRIMKPHAVEFAEGAGLEISRDLTTKKSLPTRLVSSVYSHTVYIAFGSNIEPRISFITQALRKINGLLETRIVNSSFLYESAPMFHTEQARFYNGVVKIETNFSPALLLTKLREIEKDIGRVKNFRNGPRSIDLDILFYDDLVSTTDNLTIPHSGIQDREFVLQPLVDLKDDLIHPIYQVSPKVLLERLEVAQPSQKVLPFDLHLGGENPFWIWKTKTFVMGILNISSKSFSEPGITDMYEALNMALEMESEGADIIDIGAVSRCPGSKELESDEAEIDLLVPLIKLVRAHGLSVPISVDVYKGSVAAAAVEAGANLINDVGMGVRDSEIIQVAAKVGVPICFMHTRGSPCQMHEYKEYKGNDVVDGVTTELAEVVEKALAAGVFRWNIILDPGIGFAKGGEQNMDILRNLSKIVDDDSPLGGFPLLVGPSRKKFIGDITGVDLPANRGSGSIAAAVAAISTGADIIRVHKVEENVHAAKFSDAFWRRNVEN